MITVMERVLRDADNNTVVVTVGPIAQDEKAFKCRLLMQESSGHIYVDRNFLAVDTMQSILLVFRLIRTMIPVIEEKRGKPLYLYESDDECGFPEIIFKPSPEKPSNLDNI